MKNYINGIGLNEFKTMGKYGFPLIKKQDVDITRGQQKTALLKAVELY